MGAPIRKLIAFWRIDQSLHHSAGRNLVPIVPLQVGARKGNGEGLHAYLSMSQ
jgi:hypothetical protein